MRSAGGAYLDLSYDETGNITYKSDVGTYRYDTTQACGRRGGREQLHLRCQRGRPERERHVDQVAQLRPAEPAHASRRQLFGLLLRARSRAVSPGRQCRRHAHRDALRGGRALRARDDRRRASSHRHYIVADGRRVAVHTRKQARRRAPCTCSRTTSAAWTASRPRPARC